MKNRRTQKRMEHVVNLVASDRLVALLHDAALREQVSRSEFIRSAVVERAKRVLRRPVVAIDAPIRGAI